MERGKERRGREEEVEKEKKGRETRERGFSIGGWAIVFFSSSLYLFSRSFSPRPNIIHQSTHPAATRETRAKSRTAKTVQAAAERRPRRKEKSAGIERTISGRKR